MEEEQEMERFDTDADFVDGEWIDGQFYSRGRKKRRVQSKQEALYGYESSASDSEREERRRRKRRNGLIIEKDRSKPMNFVSAGVPNAEPENGGEPGASTSKSGEESNDSRGGLGFESSRAGSGLGFGGAGAGVGSSGFGLGFNPSSNSGEDDNAGSGFGLGYSSNSDRGAGGGFGLGFKPGSDTNATGDEESPVLDTPLGRKLFENARKKPPAKAKSTPAKPTYKWENHGNAAVSRMMEKMGWESGKGLGKNEGGATQAIETIVRPKNMGLGFGDFIEAAYKKHEEGAEAPQKPKANEKLWMKKNKSKAKAYVSADELLKRQGEKSGARVVEKVLDMTGKQVRLVTDLKNLNAEQVMVEDDVPMPELQHNVRLLVDLVESDLQRYDSKLQHEKQTVEILRKDRDRLQKQLELQSSSLQVMQSIMTTIGEVSARRLNPEGVANVFRKLKAEHPEEYKAWNISAVALSHAVPLTAPRFNGWQPLVQPSRGIDTLLLWRDVFQEDDEPIFVEVDSSPFTRLVMEAVMPHIRRAVVVSWNARDPEPLLGFFDLWEKLLPAAVVNSVLDHLVAPKLHTEVEAWNPLKDTVPVHAWVHPWLSLLGSRMGPLCETIRVKLDSVLEAWNPIDPSAFQVLSPWYSVFDSASWDQLLLRKIIPKLNFALDVLEVNPAQQQLEYFNCVISWSPVMPPQFMIRMLEERFFPKWLDALFSWLGSNPDFDEVSLWYQGWKSLLPQELLANDRIRWQLNGALHLMNLAVEGVPLDRRSLQQRQQQQFEAPRFHHPILQQQQLQQQNADENSSLKDILEAFAAENDVKFLPKAGRWHEGLPVYGFGSVSISVDNHKQVIMAQAGEKWSSVSMGDLLRMHLSRRGGKWSS